MKTTSAFICSSAVIAGSTHHAMAWTPSASDGIARKAPWVSHRQPLQAVAVPLSNVVENTDGFTSTRNTIQNPKTVTAKSKLAIEDEWISTLDYDGFGKEVTQLGKQLLKEGGPDDTNHLRKIIKWRNLAAFAGIATMWMKPNIFTVAALSTWTYASWTLIAHHTCHGGYNRLAGPANANKFHSRKFAIGSVKQRMKDWLDWIQPEAWNVEHNRLHHYRLNELEDPDLVQRNLEFVRENTSLPMWLKYAKVFAFMPIWKWYYYAPNTFKELQIAKWKAESGQQDLPANIDTTQALTIRTLFRPKNESERFLVNMIQPARFFSAVVAPFFLARFVLLPLPLLVLPSTVFYQNALFNLITAELMTNVHSFLTIVTNHAGEDLYTFDDAVKPRTSSFYVRQIVGSANYQCGSDAVDFAQGFLNYQVEHHVWPDLSMLQYQRGAPRLKALCEKYGVPYVQEYIWERTRKTLRIMVGKTTMRSFPTEYEPAKDKA